MRILTTLLLIVIGYSASAQAPSRPKQMNGNYKWNGKTVQADTNFVDTSAYGIEILNANGNNLFFGIDTTGLSATGAVSIIPKVPSGEVNFTDSTRLIQDSILIYRLNGAITGRDTIRLPSSGGGGGATNFTDSTRLTQDSILVYTLNGVEIGRDTIRVPSTSLNIVGGLFITVTGDTINLDSVPASYITGLRDSILANQVNDSDWIENGVVLYNNTNSVVLNNDTSSNERFGVYGFGNNSLTHIVTDSIQQVNYRNSLFDFDGDTSVNFPGRECSINVGASSPDGLYCDNFRVDSLDPAPDSLFVSRFTGQNHLTFKVTDKLFTDYWFQVPNKSFSNVRPYSWYVLGSNDTLTGFDTISTVLGYSLTNYFSDYPTNNNHINGQYFSTNNTTYYEYIRFVFDTIQIVSNESLAKVGSGGITAQFHDFNVFGHEKSSAIKIYDDNRIELDHTPYQPNVDTLLAVKNDTLVSTVLTPLSGGDNINITTNNVNLDSNVNIRNKITTSLVRDTLVGDTTYTLDVVNKQAYHITLDTNAIRFFYESANLTIGQPFDITVVLESDTAKAPQTVYFEESLFYFAGGTAPTIDNTNTNSKRRNILQFKFDGVNQRLYVLSIEQWEEN